MTIFDYNGDSFEKVDTAHSSYKFYFGRRSHRLVVIDVYTRVTEGKQRQKYCLCKCDCGTIKLVHADGIRKERIKSCGCWKSEVDSAKAKAMGDANLKHGLSRSRMYGIWDGMKYRCENPKASGYEHYGGRGITYDPRWKDFEAFYEDMKDGYEEHLTIERIDVNGNYERSNCTWITMLDQQKNKRSSKK